MRGHLKVLVVVGVASAVAWGTWGVYAGMAVILAYGLSLLARAALLFRGREGESRTEEISLVAVTGPLAPFKAELVCELLESEGIDATYYGRANAANALPGGGVSVALGRVSVAVDERAAKRAVELVAEMNETGEGHKPQPVTSNIGESDYGRGLPNDALKAFGLDQRHSRLWNTLVRRRRG